MSAKRCAAGLIGNWRVRRIQRQSAHGSFRGADYKAIAAGPGDAPLKGDVFSMAHPAICLSSARPASGSLSSLCDCIPDGRAQSNAPTVYTVFENLAENRPTGYLGEILTSFGYTLRAKR
jgi:hypothetical protein